MTESSTVFASVTRRILIADDNRDWADALALLMADEGYRVRVAYDGREALQEASDFRPHAVVLDVWMPGMTGFEAGRVFSRHPDGTRPFLIAVTGSPETAGQNRAALAGFDRYLSKSADSTELLEVLRSLWR